MVDTPSQKTHLSCQAGSHMLKGRESRPRSNTVLVRTLTHLTKLVLWRGCLSFGFAISRSRVRFSPNTMLNCLLIKFSEFFKVLLRYCYFIKLPKAEAGRS